jgi:hypothetical protein
MCFKPRVKTPATNHGTMVVLLSSPLVVDVKHIRVSDLTSLAEVSPIGCKGCVFVRSTPLISLLKSPSFMVIGSSRSQHAPTEFWLVVITLFESLSKPSFVSMVALQATLVISLWVVLLPLGYALLVTFFAVEPPSNLTGSSLVSVVTIQRFYFVAGLAFSGHACIVAQG